MSDPHEVVEQSPATTSETHPPEPQPQPPWLIWTLYVGWRIWRGFRWLGHLLWRLLLSTKLRRSLTAISFLATVYLSVKLVPIAWNRAVLLDEARFLASCAEGRDEGEIQEELRKRACQLGFHEVVSQPDAFRVSFGMNESGPTCSIRMDIQHTLTFGSLGETTLHVRGTRTRIIHGARPKPVPLLERLLAE